LPTVSNSIRRARPLLGTFVEVEVGGAGEAEMNAAVEAAFDAVANVHKLMSFHERDSDVSRLNNDASRSAVCVHAWTFQVLQAALDLHRRSGGVFDIAVAPLLQEMGLLPRTRDNRPSNLSGEATTEAIEILPGRHVRFKHPDTSIDLGGIAKGFAVDRAIDVLRYHGMPTALVNAGGDLAAFGQRAFNVDIRDPRDPGRSICRVGLSTGAMASSGGCFDPFRSTEAIGSPIIDPRNRKPVGATQGATIRASCCMLADALTKVVMIAGRSASDLLEYYRAGALLVSEEGVQMTPDFADAVCLAA
jgi:thiamine biosynthesis lipoprotein